MCVCVYGWIASVLQMSLPLSVYTCVYVYIYYLYACVRNVHSIMCVYAYVECMCVCVYQKAGSTFDLMIVARRIRREEKMTRTDLTDD